MHSVCNRLLTGLACLAVLFLVACEGGEGGTFFAISNASTAEQLKQAPTERLLWALGSQIPSAVLSGKAGAGAEITRVAQALEVSVPELPPSGSNAQTAAREWLSQNLPGLLSRVKAKHGEQAAALFEAAWLTTALDLAAITDHKREVLRLDERAQAAGLPSELYKPFVYAAQAGREEAELRGRQATLLHSIDHHLAQRSR